MHGSGVGAHRDLSAPPHLWQSSRVACAAALKNIEIMKNEKLVENSRQMGVYFLERLKTLERHPIVGEVRGTGLWTAIDLTSDKKTRALFPGEPDEPHHPTRQDQGADHQDHGPCP